jgi:succinyl-diaminopimelate desuccinylase
MMQTALELARKLIRCPSVTPADGGSIACLEHMLRHAGFSTEQITFAEPGTPSIQNLYARIGNHAPFLIFAGHTDVVPIGNAADWHCEPFAAEIKDGQLWGRGAADMKGAVAAFASAAAQFVADHPRFAGSIGFLITGDEEGPSINGTDKLLRHLDAKGERFDHCVVGEPTNPEYLGQMIKIGRRGSLNGTLIVHGRQGHVAYPQRAVNPIPQLLTLIQALLTAPLDQGTEHFDASNLEFVNIEVGNSAFNVIPGAARARFNIRFNDLWIPETLQAELAARLADLAKTIDFEFQFEPCNALAFLTAPDRFTDLVIQAIERHTGHKPVLSTSGGTSDARFIRAYCPVLVFGLVGQTMHMVDERVSVADIDSLTKIYTAILESYFP